MVELELEGRKRVRKVRPSPSSWTKAKERAFIAALAENSCNVKLAAKTAKRFGECDLCAAVARRVIPAGLGLRRSRPAMRSWR